ncbi:hypothetical protein ONS96_004797 [Cadophora gregata f. sp. sojae]|nr:hypothetical protein ONS96_004797 [Cadophora gregata f. sp. sojae]
MSRRSITDDSDSSPPTLRRRKRRRSTSKPAGEDISEWWSIDNAAHHLPDTSEWIAARSDCFAYHELRRLLQDVELRCRQSRREIARSYHSGLQAADQNVLKKLYLLQEAELECRIMLATTPLETDTTLRLQSFMQLSKVWNGTACANQLQTQLTTSLGQEELPKNAFLVEREKALCSHMDRIFASINQKEFQKTFQEFKNIKSRHPHVVHTSMYQTFMFERTNNDLKSANAGQARIRVRQSRNQATRLRTLFLPTRVLLHDNLFHASALLQILKERTSTRAKHPQVELDQVWNQLLAIIAIANGSVAEPAFFLSTMEFLVSLLKAGFGFQDIDTPRIEKKRLDSGLTQFHVSDNNRDPSEYMVGLGEVFAEFVLFVHGSMVAAFFNSWNVRPGTISMSPTSMQAMLDVKGTCKVCLETVVRQKGVYSEGVSIGMRDKRRGDLGTRTLVSENRDCAYECFASYSIPRTLASFFFFFAEIYHSECRRFREKETLLALS